MIENKPGAGGNVAAELVAHSAPDGYTLLMGNNRILATNGALFSKLSYNAEKDFAPISMVGTQPNILVVNPTVPAHSVAELMALAKEGAHGKLNYGNSGYGAAARSCRRAVQGRMRTSTSSASITRARRPPCRM